MPSRRRPTTDSDSSHLPSCNMTHRARIPTAPAAGRPRSGPRALLPSSGRTPAVAAATLLRTGRTIPTANPSSGLEVPLGAHRGLTADLATSYLSTWPSLPRPAASRTASVRGALIRPVWLGHLHLASPGADRHRPDPASVWLLGGDRRVVRRVELFEAIRRDRRPEGAVDRLLIASRSEDRTLIGVTSHPRPARRAGRGVQAGG